MKNKDIKARVNQLLVEIHRGFRGDITKELSAKEVLATVPPSKLSPKENIDGETYSLRSTPFTYRWVAKQVKKQPTITAYDMLVKAGFIDKEVAS